MGEADIGSCVAVTGDLIKRLDKEGREMDARRPGDFSPITASLHIAVRSAARAYCSDGAYALETDSALATAPVEFADQIAAACKRGLPLCESAIEKMILPWLIAQEYPLFRYNPSVLLPGEQALYVPRTVAVIPQLKIGRYRADFALAASRGGLIRFVIVECDGKEFHDGVANVVRDVDRDVSILSNDRVLDIIRIGGKKIFKDPKAAAKIAARGVADAWSVTKKENDHKFSKLAGGHP